MPPKTKRISTLHTQYTTWTPVVHDPRNDKVEKHTHTPNGIEEEAVSADGAGRGSATYGAALTTQEQGVLTSSNSYRRSRPSLMSNTSSEVSGSTAATCTRATKKEGTHDDVVGSTVLMVQASAHSRRNSRHSTSWSLSFSASFSMRARDFRVRCLCENQFVFAAD